MGEGLTVTEEGNRVYAVSKKIHRDSREGTLSGSVCFLPADLIRAKNWREGRQFRAEILGGLHSEEGDCSGISIRRCGKHGGALKGRGRARGHWIRRCALARKGRRYALRCTHIYLGDWGRQDLLQYNVLAGIETDQNPVRGEFRTKISTQKGG